MEEIWKDVKDYEGLYQISNYGRVKSLARTAHSKYSDRQLKEIIMSPKTTRFGYYAVRLCKNGKKKDFLVHRLVAQAFIPNNFNLPQINHKDENRKNNNVENLEWCDASYNINYGNRNKKVSEKISRKVAKYDLEGNLLKVYKSMTEAQNENGIWHSEIGKCCRKISKTASNFMWEYAD